MKIYKKTIVLIIALIFATIFVFQAYAQASTQNCIGVGTNDPKAFLDVRGDSNPPDARPDQYKQVNIADITGDRILYVGVDTTNDYGGMGYYNKAAERWGPLVLQGSLGNVGIGTTDPQKKLHVKGDTRIEGTLIANAVQMADGSSVIIPRGMLAPFAAKDDASPTAPCPPGWAHYPLLDDAIPRGTKLTEISAKLGTTGGADTHAHFISGARNRGREDASAAQDLLWTQQSSSWPPFIHVIWCRKL